MQARTIRDILPRILGLAWCTWIAAAGAAAAQNGQDEADPLRNPAHASYDVVALRVEFQPDTTRFTTGNGTFDGSIFDTLSVSIDPLPHDADYFRAHLRFLRHYVRRVSDGQTTLRTHLIPEVIRLPRKMGQYSPTGPQSNAPAERQKLVQLVQDAWSQADRETNPDLPALDPDRTAFLLFHAGAGRDIELGGTSLANTPEDIPSIYMDGPALQQSGVQPTFQGLPVTNTLILPETESRLGTNPLTDEPYVAEFSINGMLAATFFNFLGVPDLFNTESGESAIGPFGLMDPLGIFSYNGLFPPEPTAWTKYYLGWIEPTIRDLSSPADFSLTAVGDTTQSDAAMVRISGSEYFLVENRHRDPEMDGLNLRVWRDGETVTQQIPAGSEDFARFDPAAFEGGVVTGVDTYDFAIPGGTTEEGTIMYGGAAIWHIDERTLAAGLPSNALNVDPRHRAVDLEEADGAQDIGFESQSVLGSGPEQGTPFDLFFRGNPVRVETDRGEAVQLYENRFGPDTHPKTTNAKDGPSFLEIYEFTGPGREMSFRARLASRAGIQPVPDLRNRRISAAFDPGGSIAGRFSPSDTTLYFSTTDDSMGSVVRLKRAGDHKGSGMNWAPGAVGKPVLFQNQITALVPAAQGSGWVLRREEGASVALPVVTAPPKGAPVVVTEDGQDVLYAVFDTRPTATLIRYDGEEVEAVTAGAAPDDIVGLASAGSGQLLVVGRTKAIVLGGLHWTYDRISDYSSVSFAFGRDPNGLMGVIADSETDELLILQPEKLQRRRPVRRFNRRFADAPGKVRPVLSDLDGDGLLDILVPEDGQLTGLSRSGAVVEGFPIDLPADVVTQPVVVRFASDEAWSVLVGAIDGYVYSYEIGRSDRPSRRFPLSVGHSINATPLLHERILHAASADGVVQGWRFAEVDSVAWGQLYANAKNQKYVEATGVTDPLPGPAEGGSFLVAERTYNWPNPVRDGRTHFRFVVRRRSDVDITIVGMAGGMVDELSADAVPPGAPYEIAWDTEVPSGVYYARIRATDAEGNTATELITVAVVR